MASSYQFEIYKDNRDEYRWRFRAPNNKIVADSGEGYWNKTDCEAGIQLVKDHSRYADVEDQTKASSYGGYRY